MVMKKMKRFLSFAMSTMMILTMGTSLVSADDEAQTTYSITIHAKEERHTFGAFQIFSGNVAQLTSTETGSSTTTTYLTDAKWTDSVEETVVKAFIEKLQSESNDSSSVLSGAFSDSSLTAEKTDASAAKVMDLAEKLDTDAQKEKFAEIIGNYFAVNDEKVKGKVSESKANEKLVSGTTYYDYTISSLPAGYYIIKDIGDTTGEGGVGTKYILSVTSNSEVYSKAGQTTLTKEVSKNSSTGFGHSTDSTVGNEVYFQLTATLPEHVEDFASYRLTFEDTLPAGLTYTGIVSAKMALTRQGEVDLPEGSYSVVDANNSEITQFEGDDSTAFYIKTKNLKAYDDLDNLWNTGATVTFVYSAKLNENAQVGGSGNVNTAKLIYTNDPYVYPDSEDKTESDDPEGETPEADAIVFTYAFQGDKVDGEDENNHLSGAEFILYKDGTNEVSYVSEVDAATENIKTWSTMEYGTGKIYASKDEAIEAIINIESGNTGYAHRFVSGDEGLFKISGLGADVTFYLKETKAPAAYSIMTSPFTFKISATRTTDGTGTETLQATDHNSKPLTSNDSKDTILATITNTKGGQLPSTGGMGRTIIYAIGVILTLSAAILLVVKKRMHANF